MSKKSNPSNQVKKQKHPKSAQRGRRYQSRKIRPMKKSKWSFQDSVRKWHSRSWTNWNVSTYAQGPSQCFIAFGIVAECWQCYVVAFDWFCVWFHSSHFNETFCWQISVASSFMKLIIFTVPHLESLETAVVTNQKKKMNRSMNESLRQDVMKKRGRKARTVAEVWEIKSDRHELYLYFLSQFIQFRLYTPSIHTFHQHRVIRMTRLKTMTWL